VAPIRRGLTLAPKSPRIGPASQHLLALGQKLGVSVISQRSQVTKIHLAVRFANL
jgi:hypothetical protein